ncbi:unnamed protein product [Heligmosomoides polygyrus]|uniref:BON domain-containing protein n=1 Tax=Heligmosomoides polygyrus TaxID=6339 RepID=A0A183FFW2_HELPZ|nr:unnamed protein product [Heligmosomoides polygyrus]
MKAVGGKKFTPCRAPLHGASPPHLCPLLFASFALTLIGDVHLKDPNQAANDLLANYSAMNGDASLIDRPVPVDQWLTVTGRVSQLPPGACDMSRCSEIEEHLATRRVEASEVGEMSPC